MTFTQRSIPYRFGLVACVAGAKKEMWGGGGGEKKTKREKGEAVFTLFPIPPPLYTPTPLTPFDALTCRL